MTLRDIGEDEVIRRLVRLMPLPTRPGEGPGDDCAIFESNGGILLLKTDALVEGIHFEAAAEPERIGWKAVARVVSDFAAMGGRPDRFLVTIAIDPAEPMAWLEGVYRGMARCLNQFGGLLAGGEMTSLPAGNAVVISVSATGRAATPVMRSGGSPGDVVFVTGTLGGSIHGKHLDFSPRVEEAVWLAANFPPAAMMDLSDGLGSDLPRLAAASRCGFHVDETKLPVTPGSDTRGAWSDGEDFELLFTLRADRADALATAWREKFPDLLLTAIGRLTECPDQRDGPPGWDHFNARP